MIAIVAKYVNFDKISILLNCRQNPKVSKIATKICIHNKTKNCFNQLLKNPSNRLQIKEANAKGDKRTRILSKT